MLAYRCSHSGLLLPPDYAKQWGVKYGKGMGPEPVSMVEDSLYHCAPAKANRPEGVLHPIRQCRAQVDLVEVPEKTPESAWAILGNDEVSREKVRDIIRANQTKNHACHTDVLMAAEKVKVSK